jgi:hypothetical protein
MYYRFALHVKKDGRRENVETGLCTAEHAFDLGVSLTHHVLEREETFLHYLVRKSITCLECVNVVRYLE